jgi:hypothetical protein
MTFLYKRGHFPKLKVGDLNTKGSVLIAGQGKSEFTMVLMMGDEIVMEGARASHSILAPGKFEDRIAAMVAEELERQKAQ